MSALFRDKEDFNEDFCAWDAPKITNTRKMFLLDRPFNQPIAGWDVSKVVRIEDMFYRTS